MKKLLVFLSLVLCFTTLCLALGGCSEQDTDSADTSLDNTALSSNQSNTPETDKGNTSTPSKKPTNTTSKKPSPSYDEDESYYNPYEDPVTSKKENTTSRKPNLPGETFTLAIIPDTQQEVTLQNALDKDLFINRTKWIADNAKKLNIKAVIHTGDVVNWGNEEPDQFKIAARAIKVLTDKGLPVSIAPGNHDTAAVGVGGSAADPQNTWIRVRDTIEFNKAFPVSQFKGFTPFEEGKLDNGYYIIKAGGLDWLIMNLELWPRDEVLYWANEVVADHPYHNVIVATHSYLTADGQLYQRSEYGKNSPQKMYDYFIGQHENIKLVFSGHTGAANYREDYGVYGNKIACFLGCYHSNEYNPMQLMTVDPKDDSVTITTYVPIIDSYWSNYTVTVEDMGFIL